MPSEGSKESGPATEASSEIMNGTLRLVTQEVPGQKILEGAGVHVCRTIGTPQLRNLDPYLLFDDMRSTAANAAVGFPTHPHRGFETATIIITGQVSHKDSAGNAGVIHGGGVQWMTAGRGIVHEEMPASTHVDLWGFQLWVNLPAKDKMIKPRYQDYQAIDIPTVTSVPNVSVRVMAGDYQGHKGPIEMRNPGLLMDVSIQAGGKFELAIPDGWTVFCYVCQGFGELSGKAVSSSTTYVMGPGDYITAETICSVLPGFRFILGAGKPIGEEIVQYGPFVMNSMDEIKQAYADYQSGKLQNPDDEVWETWSDS